MKTTDLHSQSGTANEDLGVFINRLLSTVSKGTASLIARYELFPLEFFLLRSFLVQEEWTAKQLKEVLPVDLSRISRMVSKLVDRGLLYRERDASDRRVVILRLTDSGREFTTELNDRLSSHNARLLEGVSEQDRQIFFATIRKIIANNAAIAVRKTI